MKEYIFGAIPGVLLGALVAWRIMQPRLTQRMHLWQKQKQAELTLERAGMNREAERAAQARFEEREITLRTVLQHDRETLAAAQEQLQRDRRQLATQEERLARRDEAQDAREQAQNDKLAAIERRDAGISEKEETLRTQQAGLEEIRATLASETELMQNRLAEVANLEIPQAREELFRLLDEELAEEQGKRIAQHERHLQEQSRDLATEIIGTAIQRYAGEFTVESTTARVSLPDEEMKGRVIGKEGRNIRAFEILAGVDLIIDDTPNVITISCFDGVRREIARRAMQALVDDGRIQPARIEDVIVKTQQEMDRITLKAGEDGAFEADVSGIHPQLLRLLGKLRYRTSYGQNVLQHSVEVACLAGTLAAELQLDPRPARRAGLLHDIGKAIDAERDGSHPELGAEVLRRYGESEAVINAALAHHEGHEVTGITTVLTAAADAISAARPGARRENAERFIKRLEQLEEIACRHKGVAKAYAIQAGRELRVFVNSQQLKDNALIKLARDIAKQIKEEMTFPGEVKVNVIRETRQAAYAR